MLNGRMTGLRALERDDLPVLKQWRNNARMRRFYREYRELNTDDQLAWYDNVCCGNRRFSMFGIVSLDDGRLVGVCGLTNINWLLRSAELSFYIGEDDLYVDESMAPDAVLTLSRHAFRDLNMHKVWAEIYAFDTQKKELLENMGMRLDGTLRDNAFTDGTYHNSLMYSLLEEEFENHS